MFSAVIHRPALFMLCAWALLQPAEAQTPSPPPVVTAYFSERPPFTIVEGQTGILINLTKAILTEAGLKARFIELPVPFIVQLLRVGQNNALGVGWYRLPGREGDRFSLPIYQEQPVVAVMNTRAAASLGSTARLDGLLSSGLTLGLASGSSLGPGVDQKIRTQGIVPLETAVGVPAMLKLIKMGRMDYTLLSEEEARYLLQKDPTLVPGLVVVKLADAPAGNLRYFLYPENFDPYWAARIDLAIEKLANSARSPSSARTAPEPAVQTPPPPKP